MFIVENLESAETLADFLSLPKSNFILLVTSQRNLVIPNEMQCRNIQVGNFTVEEALHYIQVNIPELAKEPALADEILTFT